MNVWPKSSGKPESKFEKCNMKLQDPQWNILVESGVDLPFFDMKK